ncbi:MAG: hypothetical protein JNK18_11435 [Cyclobacteriaceae bacterium]|nr:hypothetical protein [Cyclobacteriaceae bacterium]
MKFHSILIACTLIAGVTHAQNRDPLKTEIITSDIDNFWIAFETAKPDFNPEVFQTLYLDKGSNGIKGFTPGRIRNAENLAKRVKGRIKYYSSIKPSTDKIPGMKDDIRKSLVKLKELYPEAIFPPVYFVIGTMSSGGTSSDDGLIIGAEMYGMTPETPKDELNEWLLSVLKPVEEVPHIVAHELIHFQQTYDGGTLLQACLKEGSADFITELISGKHINGHVHDFANPKEKELWLEFKEKMFEKNYDGWLYSAAPGRPNDLGYWMGYKITKAYYEKANDKKQAIRDILTIKDEKRFLKESGYEEKFK